MGRHGHWWQRRKFARALSIVLTVSMVLSLVPSQGIVEAQEQLGMVNQDVPSADIVDEGDTGGGAAETTEPTTEPEQAPEVTPTDAVENPGEPAVGEDASLDDGATPNEGEPAIVPVDQEDSTVADPVAQPTDMGDANGSEGVVDDTTQGEPEGTGTDSPAGDSVTDETPETPAPADIEGQPAETPETPAPAETPETPAPTDTEGQPTETPEGQPAEAPETPAPAEAEGQPAETPQKAPLPTSANLRDFIVSASVDGAKSENGALAVKEGETYTLRLAFAERPNSAKADLQFDPAHELTFALPAGFVPATNQPAAAEALVVRYVDAAGAEQKIGLAPGCWRIDGATIRVAFRAADAADTTTVPFVHGVENLTFDLAVTGSFAKGTTTLDLGLKVGPLALSVAPKAEDKPAESKPEEKPATPKAEEKQAEPKSDSASATDVTKADESSDAKKDGAATDATKADDRKDESSNSTTPEATDETKTDDATEATTDAPTSEKRSAEEVKESVRSTVEQVLSTSETAQAEATANQQPSGISTQAMSTNLRDFLTNATIAGATAGQDGKVTVRKGVDYGISLTFKETPDKQLDTTPNPEVTYSYQLPTGMTVHEAQSKPMTINVISNGVTYPVPATLAVNTSGQLTITVNNTHPNYHYFADATNVSMRASFNARFNDDSQSIEFSNTDKIDIKFDPDDGGRAYATKTATYNEATHTFTYTITVKAESPITHQPVLDVNVKDIITGDALIFNNDVNMTSNKNGGQVPSYTTGSLDSGQGGFNYTFSSMQDGEEITITYTATVDFTKDEQQRIKDGRIEASQTGNTVTVTPKDKPSNGSTFSKEIIYTSVNKWGQITLKDGNNVTQTWTVEANKEQQVAMSGKPFHDTVKIDNDACTVSIEGTSATIKVFDGPNEVATVTKQLRNINGSGTTQASFDVDLPTSADDSNIDSNKAYRYVIEYQTKANVAAASTASQDVTVTNDVEWEYGKTSAYGIIGSNDHSSVTKSVESYDGTEATWKTVIHVPENGLASAKVTDILPHTQLADNNWAIAIDALKIEGTLANSVTVTGLLDGESYTVSTGNNKDTIAGNLPTEVYIDFTKDGQPGLKATPGGHDITVTLTTTLDSHWKEHGANHASDGMSYYMNHENAVTFDGKQDTAMVQYGKAGVSKNVEKITDYDVDGDEKNDTLFRYNIIISDNYADTLTVEDEFDTNILELVTDNSVFANQTNNLGLVIYAGNQYNQQHNPTHINYTTTSTGVTFTSNNLPTMADGSKASWYRISYYLKLKDGVDLTQLAADNGGVHELKNTAKWNGHEGEISYRTEYDPLEKKQLTHPDMSQTDTDLQRRASYAIDFNPNGGMLNDGNDITIVDDIDEHQSLQYDTVTISSSTDQNIAQKVTYSASGGKTEDTKGHTIVTFTVPDGVHVHITYHTKVIGTGDITYSNKVSALGKTKVTSRTDRMDITGEGQASLADFKVIKVDGYNGAKKLANAKFRLTATDGSSLKPDTVGGPDFYEKELTSNSQGVIHIDGNELNIQMGTEYKLEEIESPDGYKRVTETYYFTLVDEDDANRVNYDEFIYLYNDSMQIKNWPYEGLVVEKEVQVDEGDVIDPDVEYGFKVTILNPDGSTKTDFAGTYGDMTFRSGVASFTLRHGEQKTADTLPEGTLYKVEEVDSADASVADYDVTYQVNDEAAQSGTMTRNLEASHTYTKVKYVNKEKKFGSLKLKKVVIANNTPIGTRTVADGTYTFDITGPTGSRSTTRQVQIVIKNGAIQSASGTGVKFNNTTGGFVEVEELKPGTYTIKETGSTNSSATLVSFEGGTSVDTVNKTVTVTVQPGKAGNDVADGAKATFTNDVPVGSLKVQKSVLVNGVTRNNSTVADGTYTFKIKDSTGAEKAQTTITIRNGQSNTAQVDNLIPGTYTVSEVTPTNGTKLTGGNDKRVVVTANNTASIPTASFTNNYEEYGQLEVSKALITSNRAEAENATFGFTVTLSDTTISGSYGDMEFTAGVAHFRLGGGQKRVATGLPTGITYIVTEDQATGFTVTGKVNSGDPIQGRTVNGTITTTPSKVEITNKRDEGNLTVQKVVDSPLASQKSPIPTRPSFTFTVVLQGSTLSGTFGGMSFRDGRSTFTLRDGESKSATGLPAGVRYTVTETDETGNFVTSWRGKTDTETNWTSGKSTGTIATGVTDTIEAINTHKTGGLAITKKLITNTAADLTGKYFTFTVTLSDKTITSSGDNYPVIRSGHKTIPFTDGVATVQLRHDEVASVKNLPVGITYTVSEAEVDGYVLTGKTGDTGTISTTLSEAVFTNTHNEGGITVYKRVVSDVPSDLAIATTPKKFRIKVTVYNTQGQVATTVTGVKGDFTFTNGVAEAEIKDNQTLTTGNTIESGYKYVVEELLPTTEEGIYSVKSVVGSGTIKEGKTSDQGIVGTDAGVTFTNTRETGDLTLAKRLVSGAAADANKDFTFTVKLYEKQTDSTTAPITKKYGALNFVDGVATVILHGGQSVTAKDLPVGLYYTIEEAEASGFALTGITVPTDGTQNVAARMASGTISKTASTVRFENTSETGKLKVGKKLYSDRKADWDTKFNFTVELKGLTNAAMIKQYDITYTGGQTTAQMPTKVTFPNGKASIVLYGGQTAEISGLPVGVDYVITEDTTPGFAKGGKVDTEGTISSTTTPTGTYENTRVPGDITLSKRLISDLAADANQEFTFNVQLTGLTDDTHEYDLVSGSETTKVTFTKTGDNHSADITIKGGESKTIKGIPTGVNYVVTETGLDTNQFYKSGDVGTANTVTTTTSNAVISNTRIPGSLVLSKMLISSAVADANQQFEFELTFTGLTEEAQGKAYDISYSPANAGDTGKIQLSGGKATIKLKGSQKATISGLPTGATYTITEKNADGFSLTGITKNATIVAGNVAEGTIATTAPTFEFTNERILGGFRLTKHVESATASDRDREFDFVVRLVGTTGINGPYGAITRSGSDPQDITFTNGNATFKLKDGDIAYVEDLPIGINYQIIELEAKGFETDVDGSTMTQDGTDNVMHTGVVTEENKATHEYALHTFNNKREEGNLEVLKTVESNYTPDKNKYFTFTVTLRDRTINNALSEGVYPYPVIQTGDNSIEFTNGTATFTLKDGERASISKLPAGITYTVTETSADGFTTTWTGNTNGTIKAGETASVTAKNKREPGKLDVTKIVVSHTDADFNRDFPFAVEFFADERLTQRAGDVTGSYQIVDAKGEQVKDPGGNDLRGTFTGGRILFTLKHNQTIKITDVPLGLYYQARELTPTGFTVEGNSSVREAKVTNASKESFTNTREEGGLLVSKTVRSGLNADKDREYEFKVTLYKDEGRTEVATGINQSYEDDASGTTNSSGAMSFTNGVSEFTLKDGETKYAFGLPLDNGGLYYEVREKAVDELETTVKVGVVTKSTDGTYYFVTGGITSGSTERADFVNTRENGNLEVTKTVPQQDYQYGSDEEFSFKVELDDTTINGTFGYSTEANVKTMTFVNGVATFTLKSGEKATTANMAIPASIYHGRPLDPSDTTMEPIGADNPHYFTLPVGLGYTVTETHADGYITTWRHTTASSTYTYNYKMTPVKIPVGGVFEGFYMWEPESETITLKDGTGATLEEISQQLGSYDADSDWYESTGNTSWAEGDISTGWQGSTEFVPEIAARHTDVVEFTNTPEVGSFVVRKTVQSGLTSDHTREYHFRVELGDRSISTTGTNGAMTFTDGVAEFDLKEDEYKWSGELPKGVRYRIIENAYPEYTQSNRNDVGVVGYVLAGEEEVVADTWIPKDGTPDLADIEYRTIGGYDNMRENGILAVRKSVNSDLDSDKKRTYEFEIQLDEDDFGELVDGHHVFSFYPAVQSGDEMVLDKENPLTFTNGVARLTLDADQTAYIGGDYWEAVDIDLHDPSIVSYVLDFYDDSFDKSKWGEGLPKGIGYTIYEIGDDGSRDGAIEGMTTSWSGKSGIIQDTVTNLAECVNTRETGGLELSKEVISDAKADHNQVFTFTVTLYADAARTKVLTEVSKGYGDLTFDKGVATVEIKEGDVVRASGLPLGAYYTVTEESVDGFRLNDITKKVEGADAVSQKNDGKATGDIGAELNTVAFTNERIPGDLSISKALISKATADQETVYTFTIRLADNSITKTYPVKNPGDIEINFVNGIATVKLKKDQTASADGLPTGIGYTVTEDDAPGFIMTTQDSSTQADTIIQNTTKDIVNQREEGNLTVRKHVVSPRKVKPEEHARTGRQGDESKLFTFKVTLDDPNISGEFGEMNFGPVDVDGEQKSQATFQLKDGEEKTATGLPTSLKYTVEELDEEGFFISGFSGLAGEITTVPSVADVTNERITTGDLMITKIVEGLENTDDDQVFTFTVTLIDPETGATDTSITKQYPVIFSVGDPDSDDKPLNFVEGVAEVSLKTYQSASAVGLPIGYKYTVAEDTESARAFETKEVYEVTETTYLDEEGVYSSRPVPDEAQVIVDNEVCYATFTNSRVETWAGIKKVWKDDELANVEGTSAQPEKIDVSLFRDGEFVKSVELNEENGWSEIVKDLPKLKYNGDEYTYTWSEDPEQIGDYTLEVVDGGSDIEEVEATDDESGKEITYPVTTLTNTRDLGNLQVTKHLVLPEGETLTDDEMKDIKFTVTGPSDFKAPEPRSLYDMVAKNDEGVVEWPLKADPVWLLENIPTGEYTVTETGATRENWVVTTTYSVKSGKTEVVKGGTAEVVVTNTYLKPAVGEVHVIKNLIGRPWRDGDSFTFKLEGVEGAPMPKTTSISIDSKAANEGFQNSFGEIIFSKAGEYTYTVTETKGDAKGLTYDTGKHEVTFSIVDNGAHELVAATDSNLIQTTEITNTYTPDKPSFDKKIRDVNDSTGKKSGWQDSADYDIGDAVPYKLTAKLADDVTDYRKYHVTFTDRMETSLDYNGDATVRVIGNDGKVVDTETYNVSLTPDEDGHGFRYRLDWTGAEITEGEAAEGEGVEYATIANAALNGATVEVQFTATLNESAKLGKEGNVNAAKLSYSNNPASEDDSDEGELPWDYVIAFTYKLDLSKVDPNAKPLTGAEFTLEKYVKETDAWHTVDLAAEGSTFTATGVDDGTYRLTETKAPRGYVLLSPIEFEVSADHVATWNYETEGIAEVAFDEAGDAGSGRLEILSDLTGKTADGELVLEHDEALASLSGTVENTPSERPKFNKKIKDINDSTGEQSGWQDSADYDIGDAVPYKLTAKLASNVTDYRKYHVTFSDQMEESLDYNRNATVAVIGSDGEVMDPETYTVEKIAEGDHDFQVKVSWTGEGDEAIANEALNGATVEVEFTATLNTAAKLGKEGNVNACKLAYSNNPASEDDSDEGELPWDYVIAFTYKLDLSKVDPNAKPLTGAEFTLEKYVKETDAWHTVDLAAEGSTFTATGVDDGTYRITETKAPEGFRQIDPITFVVTASHGATWAYTSPAAEDPSFSPESRMAILTKLSGEAETGELVLEQTDEQLSGLKGDIKNTPVEQPEFEKKIKDVNDTTGETSGWQDSADYDIGDAVPYKLTAKLAANVTAYRKYHVTFTDRMETTLTYNGDATVTVIGNDGEVVDTETYNVSMTPDGDGHGFQYRIDWAGAEDATIANEALNGATVEVEFTATLNERAKLGKEGNVNAAKLAFSNNPASEDDSDEGELPWDYVIAFTYEVDLSKVDADANPLTGAEFRLEKLIAGGEEESYQEVALTAKGNVFTGVGLDDGIYRLTETKAPDGYEAIEPIMFEVTADHKVTWNYKTEAAKRVAFDAKDAAGSGRTAVLTALTGNATTGVLELQADEALAKLQGDVVNVEKPTFEKKIQDVNDTTGERSGWQDSADYDIGDAVPYKLSATLPKDVTSFERYHITFTDQMEESLTFNEASVVVQVNGEELGADAYTLTTEDEQHFSVRIDWEGDAITEALNGATVDVYFSATLNAAARLGKPGNVNAAKLAYSAHPGEDGMEREEELPWDYVIAFTYKLDLNKVNQDAEPLEGAKFRLDKVLADGSTQEIELTNEGNVFTGLGLDDGTYILTETVAPEGYIQMLPIAFTVTADHQPDTAWAYLSDPGEEVNFDVDGAAGSGRTAILAALTGEEVTGRLAFATDEALEGLSSSVANTRIPDVDSASIALVATKKLDGRTLRANEFSFVLKDSGGRVLQTKRNTAQGAITFDSMTYFEEGTIEYTISEVKGSATGVTYDTHVTKVTVTVKKDDAGKLQATASYEGGSATFTNVYRTTSKTTASTPRTADPTNLTAIAQLAGMGALSIAAGGLGRLRRRRKREE